MRFRNTIFAFLVLAGLGAFIYYYEYRGEEARDLQAASDANVLTFQADKVRAIEITKQSGEPLRLSKQGDGWMLDSPLKTNADGEKVATLLSGIGLLRVEKKLDGIAESELGEFKLKEPAVRVKLTVDEPAGELSVDLGDKTPIGSEYYARKPGAAEVLLVSGDISRLLSADAASLRYKKLVGLDSWRVAGFQVQKGAETVGFVHDTGAEEWRLDQPISFPADATKVQGLWMDLQGAEAEAFETENATPADLQRLGLDKPALTVTVRPMSEKTPGDDQAHAAQDRPPIHVSFSVPSSEGKVYARRDAAPAVMRIGKETYEKLGQAVADLSSYRDQRAVPVDRWKLTIIELKSATGPLKLLKSDDDSSWHRESTTGPVVEPEQANALIDAIDAIKASGYIDGAAAVQSMSGSQIPLTVTVQEGSGESGRTVSMKILAQGSGAGADSTQRRVTSSASSSIYLIPAAAVQTLLDKAASIAQVKAPASPPSTPASPLEPGKP